MGIKISDMLLKFILTSLCPESEVWIRLHVVCDMQHIGPGNSLCVYCSTWEPATQGDTLQLNRRERGPTWKNLPSIS